MRHQPRPVRRPRPAAPGTPRNPGTPRTPTRTPPRRRRRSRALPAAGPLRERRVQVDGARARGRRGGARAAPRASVPSAGTAAPIGANAATRSRRAAPNVPKPIPDASPRADAADAAAASSRRRAAAGSRSRRRRASKVAGARGVVPRGREARRRRRRESSRRRLRRERVVLVRDGTRRYETPPSKKSSRPRPYPPLLSSSFLLGFRVPAASLAPARRALPLPPRRRRRRTPSRASGASARSRVVVGDLRAPARERVARPELRLLEPVRVFARAGSDRVRGARGGERGEPERRDRRHEDVGGEKLGAVRRVHEQRRRAEAPRRRQKKRNRQRGGARPTPPPHRSRQQEPRQERRLRVAREPARAHPERRDRGEGQEPEEDQERIARKRRGARHLGRARRFRVVPIVVAGERVVFRREGAGEARDDPSPDRVRGGGAEDGHRRGGDASLGGFCLASETNLAQCLSHSPSRTTRSRWSASRTSDTARLDPSLPRRHRAYSRSVSFASMPSASRPRWTKREKSSRSIGIVVESSTPRPRPLAFP